MHTLGASRWGLQSRSSRAFASESIDERSLSASQNTFSEKKADVSLKNEAFGVKGKSLPHVTDPHQSKGGLGSQLCPAQFPHPRTCSCVPNSTGSVRTKAPLQSSTLSEQAPEHLHTGAVSALPSRAQERAGVPSIGRKWPLLFLMS